MARLGNAFPHEGFVQAALGRRFAGCERINVGHTDFACIDDVGVKWIIEAKGETSSTGLDFRTGLGQIVQAMEDPDARYALAMPDTAKFMNQRRRVSERVRAALGLYWILAAESGELAIVEPLPAEADRP